MFKSRRKLSKPIKYILQGLPLAGAASSVFLPLGQFARQFMVLVVVMWMQVYFVMGLFDTGK